MAGAREQSRKLSLLHPAIYRAVKFRTAEFLNCISKVRKEAYNKGKVKYLDTLRSTEF